MKSVIKNAKSIDEAVSAALLELGVAEDMVTEKLGMKVFLLMRHFPFFRFKKPVFTHILHHAKIFLQILKIFAISLAF